MSLKSSDRIPKTSKVVKRFEKYYEPIEIKEPYKPVMLEFANPDEFTNYYRDHEDEFLNMTTYKLNMKFKIPGYRISQPTKKMVSNEDEANNTTREIKLIKDYRIRVEKDKHAEESDETEAEESSQLKEKINRLESYIKVLEEKINNIETYLQQ